MFTWSLDLRGSTSVCLNEYTQYLDTSFYNNNLEPDLRLVMHAFAKFSFVLTMKLRQIFSHLADSRLIFISLIFVL